MNKYFVKAGNDEIVIKADGVNFEEEGGISFIFNHEIKAQFNNWEYWYQIPEKKEEDDGRYDYLKNEINKFLEGFKAKCCK